MMDSETESRIEELYVILAKQKKKADVEITVLKSIVSDLQEKMASINDWIVKQETRNRKQRPVFEDDRP